MFAEVVLDSSSFWLLAGLMGLAFVASLVASLAALRAAKTARVALEQLEVARREVVVPDREWRERSAVPRRASDAAVAATVGRSGRPPARATDPHASSDRPTPPKPAAGASAPTSGGPADAVPESETGVRVPRPAPSSPPPRSSDTLEDPDRGRAPLGDLPPRRVTAAPPPEPLLTEPLSRPRTPPTSQEREVQPGVFVTTPGQGGVQPAAPVRTEAVPSPDATPAGPTPPPETPAEASTRSSGAAAPEPVDPPVPPPPGAPTHAPRSATSPAEADASAPGTADPSPAEQADPRLQRLDDPDPFVRIEAMDQLRGHPALVGALVGKLHDDFPVVRRQAVRALREAGTPDATKALLEVANQDPSAEVREEAVGALAALLRDAKPQPEAPGSKPVEPRNGTDPT